MGITVKIVGSDQYIEGSKAMDGLPPVHVYDCYFGGPDLLLDMSWLGEVDGLESVDIRKVRFNGGHYGRRELLHLIEGRTVALIVGCRICSLPIDGAAGASDVCPEELSFRCVLSS